MLPSAVDNPSGFSHWQLEVLVTVERVGGSVSLAALLLIFLAFALVPASRNVQNTFIVFASVSNVGASIASIIALDGLAAGKASALCQAQSFMFEMFMQSDPWWSLAMAINVFLVFFFHTNPSAFQKWWWLYCLICYGGPFVIAIALLLVRVPGRPPVYGSAVIWCWVDNEWEDIRIYSYYMLIWVCILGSFLCYFLVGYHVFHTRNKVRSYSSFSKKEAPRPAKKARVDLLNLPEDGYYGTVVTEVQVTHSKPSEPKRAVHREHQHVSFDEPQANTPNQPSERQYFSTVTSRPAQKESVFESEHTTWQRITAPLRSAANRFVVEDPIKRAYLRTSFLFAFSVLVTWIPSSMNRIHSWRYGSSGYEYQVATAAVLPLQGLWNSVIFFMTSYEAVWARYMWWRTKDHAVEPDTTRRQDAVVATGALDRVMSRERHSPLTGDSDLDGSLACSTNGSEVELTRIGAAV